MNPEDLIRTTRRDFLATSASGLGSLALASLFQADGLLAAAPAAEPGHVRGAGPHFAPKAKS